jgi:hypothetical protein
MGELRTNMGDKDKSDKPSTPDELTDELLDIQGENEQSGNKLVGRMGDREIGAETEPTEGEVVLMMFGKPEKAYYSISQNNPDRVVVVVTRDDGSKTKTNFSREDFEKRKKDAADANMQPG